MTWVGAPRRRGGGCFGALPFGPAFVFGVAGTPDAVVRPSSAAEVAETVRAAVAAGTPIAVKSGGHGSDPVTGGVVIDLAARSATRTRDGHDAPIRLTPTEWQVIEILIRNTGNLVTRQTLLTSIWGTEHATDTGYLRLYVSQLRKKLEPEPSHPRYLITEAGMGYRLHIDRPNTAAAITAEDTTPPLNP